MPHLSSIDHLVLTVADMAATVEFYSALGLIPEEFTVADGTVRKAMAAPGFKLNLHPAKEPYAPHAKIALPGTVDLCFETAESLDDWVTELSAKGLQIIEGPVRRTGARGPMMSIYLRDPDGNLVEIARYG